MILSIIGSDNGLPANHYLIQCWNIVNWAPRNTLQWNLWIFIEENAFQNVVRKIATILSRPQCGKPDAMAPVLVRWHLGKMGVYQTTAKRKVPIIVPLVRLFVRQTWYIINMVQVKFLFNVAPRTVCLIYIEDAYRDHMPSLKQAMDWRPASYIPLQWCHNERNGVPNHRRLACLINSFFRHRSAKASNLRVTGLYEGNSPVTGKFRVQRASNTENVFIWCRHHASPHQVITGPGNGMSKSYSAWSLSTAKNANLFSLWTLEGNCITKCFGSMCSYPMEAWWRIFA